MARHISVEFRQEYIQAGQTYSPSNNAQQTLTVLSSNKRKDLSSPSDQDMPSPKVIKSKPSYDKVRMFRNRVFILAGQSINPFRCK